jgi:hypothetical protein
MQTTKGQDMATNGLDDLLANIASEHLGIETLETRHADSLDFHDLAVWQVRRALEAAYAAGAADAESTK